MQGENMIWVYMGQALGDLSHAELLEAATELCEDNQRLTRQIAKLGRYHYEFVDRAMARK